MSADFETCPVGTMAKLRRIEEAAAKVIKRWDSPMLRVTIDTAFLIDELRRATGYVETTEEC